MTNKKQLHQSLGSYLKKKRIEAKVTQAEVANVLGYSTAQFISNFERGLCSPPLKHLKKIVKMYNIPPDEVIEIIMDEQKKLLVKWLSNKREICG